MSRVMFMNELRERLKNIPYDEFNSAINFYEEYFEEAGAENEQSVIRELGSPQQVAAKIIGDFAMKKDDNIGKKDLGLSKLWIVILAMFASPIAIPVAIGIIAAGFGMIVALLSVLFAIGVSGVSMVAGGISGVIKGFSMLVLRPIDGIFALGGGLLVLAIGGLFMAGIYFIGAKGVGFITRVMGSFLKGSEK